MGCRQKRARECQLKCQRCMSLSCYDSGCTPAGSSVDCRECGVCIEFAPKCFSTWRREAKSEMAPASYGSRQDDPLGEFFCEECAPRSDPDRLPKLFGNFTEYSISSLSCPLV